MSLKFISNSELAIQVRDLSKARDFYSGILGFQLLSDSEGMLEFDTGSFRLYVEEYKETKRSFIPSLDVKDIEEARKHLESNGCEVFHQNEKGFYFRDPFGFVIDVIER